MIVLTMLEMFYKPWMMVVNMVTSTSSLIVWLTWKRVVMTHLTLIHLGHPLPCSSGCCTSWLYTLRAAAVHYPILRTLLNNIYRARRSHCGIRDIESGLSEGSVSSLKKFLKVQELSELLDDEQSATTEGEYLSTSESCLEVEFAAIIEIFYDKLKEDPEYTCCSCQKLLLKKVLTSFNFTTEKFKSSTWEQLKNYLRERDPEVSTQELYICKDCECRQYSCTICTEWFVH